MSEADIGSEALCAQCLQVLILLAVFVSVHSVLRRNLPSSSSSALKLRMCRAPTPFCLHQECKHQAETSSQLELVMHSNYCLLRTAFSQVHKTIRMYNLHLQAVLHAADVTSAHAAALLLGRLTPPVATLKPLQLAMQVGQDVSGVSCQLCDSFCSCRL